MWHEIFAGVYFCRVTIFCVWRDLIFALSTEWFFLLGIKFFAIFKKYRSNALITFSFSLRACNRNTDFKTILCRQKDLTLAIGKATNLLQKMKFTKKLKQSRIDDVYNCISKINSLEKDKVLMIFLYNIQLVSRAHLISSTVQYCFLISFCLYRACFTRLISSNMRCNLCL